jgi:hypothetical protein
VYETEIEKDLLLIELEDAVRKKLNMYIDMKKAVKATEFAEEFENVVEEILVRYGYKVSSIRYTFDEYPDAIATYLLEFNESGWRELMWRRIREYDVILVRSIENGEKIEITIDYEAEELEIKGTAYIRPIEINKIASERSKW